MNAFSSQNITIDFLSCASELVWYGLEYCFPNMIMTTCDLLSLHFQCQLTSVVRIQSNFCCFIRFIRLLQRWKNGKVLTLIFVVLYLTLSQRCSISTTHDAAAKITVDSIRKAYTRFVISGHRFRRYSRCSFYWDFISRGPKLGVFAPRIHPNSQVSTRPPKGTFIHGNTHVLEH